MNRLKYKKTRERSLNGSALFLFPDEVPELCRENKTILSGAGTPADQGADCNISWVRMLLISSGTQIQARHYRSMLMKRTNSITNRYRV